MNAVEWLQTYAPGFHALSDDERQAITEFSFLWSLFEAKSLNERGSANAIVESANRWAVSGQLTEDWFSCELAYFVTGTWLTANSLTTSITSIYARMMRPIW